MGSFFLNGGLAWTALALTSIPIIIHLLNRRRFRKIDWAAMEFLLQALKKNRRRIRLESLVLLALRVLLIGLIGLAIARPVIGERGLAWLGSAFRSEEKVFVLDDSFSMSRREADRTAFDRARSALEAQVRRLSERGSTRDRFTLLRGTRPESPLYRGAFLDRERAAIVERAIGSLSHTDGRMALADAIRAISARRGEEGPPRPRSIVIVTDFRAADWTDGRGGPDEELRAELAKLSASEEAPSRIAVLDVGSDDTANLAIVGARVEGNPIAEIPTEIRVTVRNFGPSAARDLGLRVRYAKAPASPGGDAGVATAIGPAIAELPAGGSVDHVILCTFREPGSYGVLVELTGARDPLPGDDTFAIAVEAVPATEVLLVNGEPSSEPLEGETDFLEQALAAPGEVPSGILPTVVVEEGFPRSGLDRHSAIFLANVHGPSPETIQALKGYVERGGALVVFLGDQVDPGLYNRLGAADSPGGPAGASPTPFFPAKLGDLRDASADPLRLAPLLDHVYFRTIREAADILSTARFSKHFALEPAPAAQAIARFSDASGTPAIVEHAHGAGRVIFVGTSADLEWSDWPRNPSYLMWLHEVVAAAARARIREAEHMAGAPIEVPMDLAVHSREARARAPGYPDVPERTITAEPVPSAAQGALAGAGAPVEGAAFRFVVRDTDRAGLYALALRKNTGGEEWILAAARRHPAESDLGPMNAARLRELYPEAPIEVLRDPSAFEGVGRGSFEASDFILALVVILVFVEAFLARRFARHRTAEGGAR